MINSKTYKQIAIFTLIHFILCYVFIILSFGTTMSSFDDPDYIPSLIDNIISLTSDVLVQPMMSLIDMLNLGGTNDILQWMLFALNSLVWGISVIFLIHSVSKIRR